MGHSTHLTIKSFLYPLASIHTEHKYLHTLPFRGIYPHTSLLDLLVFQWCSFQSNYPAKPRFSADPFFWPSLLPGKMNKQVHCSRFCPLGGFPFPTVFLSCPKEKLWYHSRPPSGDACMSCRTIYKPSLRLFFLSQLFIGNPQEGMGVGGETTMQQNRAPGQVWELVIES